VDKNKRARPNSPSPSESPTRAGYFESIAQLQENVACTWKGILMLKKAEYPLRFLQKFLIQNKYYSAYIAFLVENISFKTGFEIHRELPSV
jgi:hypothetical protein